MAALTTARLTPQMGDESLRIALPMADDASIFKGALVMLNAAGRAVRAFSDPNLKPMGVLVDQRIGLPSDRVVNPAGGSVKAEVVRGIFKFENDGSDPIDVTMIGDACFALDDQTVSATDGGGAQSVAGRIINIDDGTSPTGPGVWVEIANVAIA